MHLVIPFAAPLPEAGQEALRALRLPNLAALLGQLAPPQPGDRDEGDEWSMSPPHERVLARERGLAFEDGLVPTAAWQAREDGLATGTAPWGLLTPSHWVLGSEQLNLSDPEALALEEAESRRFLEAVRELFESEGFELVYGAPTRWYASHPGLAGLPTAALDRVIGRNVDRWLDPHPRARLVRRLQSEVQMVWQHHPLNEAREARGLPQVNSVWLSGCGVAPEGAPPPDLTVDERLRRPALEQDWAAWQRAWEALDAEALAGLREAAQGGGAARLTLCGERSASTLRLRPAGVWSRLSAIARRPDPRELLAGL
jgi:hypothetical protein